MKHFDLSNSRLISTHIIPLRWVDMDAYHHVNNARYFDYMAETRAIFLAPYLKDRTVQFVLVHVSCDFKKPLVYPKNVWVKQYLSELTRTTFTCHYTFHEENDEDTVYAMGKGVLVSLCAQNLKPVPVPDAIRNLLTA